MPSGSPERARSMSVWVRSVIRDDRGPAILYSPRMADTQLSPSRFEAIITSAVDRQVSEQRTLTGTLESLGAGLDAAREATDRAASEVQSLVQVILELSSAVQERFAGVESRIGSLEDRVA